MALEGKFELTFSQKKQAKEWSFSLKNTSHFSSETFDCVLIDCFSLNPWYFLGQKLKAGKTMRFNSDTIPNFSNFKGWCVGDRFAIIDARHNRIIKFWTLNNPVYDKEQCPDCNGSKKCSSCGGKGIVTDPVTSQEINCKTCGGTGVCITCGVPFREQPADAVPVASDGPSFNLN